MSSHSVLEMNAMLEVFFNKLQ